MKTTLIILVLVILTITFLPVYKGRVICGFNPEKGCWNTRINLIDYLKYKNQ